VFATKTGVADVTDLTGRNERAALRIAGGQLEALLRERAAYRRAQTSQPRRLYVVRDDR
jgi:hypothetical protein